MSYTAHRKASSLVGRSQSGFHVSIRDDSELCSVYTDTDTNWRNIIFIPHKMQWKILVAATIVFNIIIASYYLVFTNVHLSVTYSVPFYACEAVYFVDVTLALMHRSMSIYRRSRLYKPRHALLLTVDIISLLPYYEMYYMIEHCSYGEEYPFFRDYMKLKVMLRLQYVIAFYRSVRNHPTVNQIVVVICGQFYIFALYVVFASCIWYLLKDIETESWVIYLYDYQFNRESGAAWFIICLNVIGNCFMHSFPGPISAITSLEYFIYNITMLIGCLIHVMIFFGDLTAQHIHKYKHQLEFSARLHIIIVMMRDWQTEESVQKKTIEHYHKYWEMRQGMKNIPDKFCLLPLSMQKEITLDLFWECLVHSHLFGECEMNFKRSLALEMKTEFYLPGDYLFCAGENKWKMAYLSSGIVQILSQEDQESPVMSFSSGTLFGEIATMFVVPSLINIRCATYCEIYTLDLKSLSYVMMRYKTASRVLHKMLKRRIRAAKMMQNPILLKMKDKQQKRTSFRWLKNQWRFIYSQRKKKSVNVQDIQVTPCHMSNYLSLYALSGDVELKEKVICLKSTCPYVLEPTSSFRCFWEYVIVCIVLTQCIAVPYLVFFGKSMSVRHSGFFYIMDFMYILGLYMDLSTAVKEKELIITEPKEILIYKSKKLSVIVDVIACLPLELAAYILNRSQQSQMLMHLNRILKIHKIYTLMMNAEKNLMSNALRLRLLKFSIIFAYCIYFFGCILYGIACPDSTCLRYGWFKYNQELELKSKEEIPKELKCSDFIISINYAVSTLLGLTNSSIYNYTLLDIVVGLIITFFGYCMSSFCFSELAACTVLQLQHINDFQELIKVIKKINSNDMPSHLKRSMYDITMCEWNYNKRYIMSGENGVLRDAPHNLKRTILHKRIVHCLERVPFFQQCNKTILWNLAPLFLLNIVPPGTILAREDSYQRYLKVILRGYCKIQSSIPTDSYHKTWNIYSTGNIFPLMELLVDVNTFLRVTAITFVEVACIPYVALHSELKNNDPDFYSDIQITIEKYIKENDIILMRKKGRLPEMVSSVKSYGKGEYFSYESNEQFDDVGVERYQTVGVWKWKIVHRLFLRTTISPNKPFYITWESIRCTISIINVAYTLSIMKTCTALKYDHYIEIFFFMVAILDFYFRMHCQYYSEKGILITHPLYTARHYISNAFILDLYCNFPFFLFRIDKMFHGRFRIKVPTALMLITRPFQIYRVYFGIEYIQNRSKEDKAIWMERLKYALMIFVIFGMCACALEHITCTHSPNGKYICDAYSWIDRSLFINGITQPKMVLLTNYKILTLFTTSAVGIFTMKTSWETVVSLFLIFVLFALKWFILAKIISSAIKGNTKLVEYQHNVNVMSKFLKKNLIQESLLQEAVEHYENLFSKTKGYDDNYTAGTFFLVLWADVTHYRYWPVLEIGELFSGNKSLDMRYFCTNFTECHYKKDAEIIRCNDVQDYCFIVYKGKVKISVAGSKLRVLNQGGCFGCYQLGKTRQTINATAMVHVELLRIKSDVLHSMSHRFPVLKRRLRKAQYLKMEYMGSKYVEPANKKTIIQHTNYFTKWQRFLIYPSNKWYALYNYMLNVHVSVISSMIAILFVVKIDTFHVYNYVLYTFDVIFYTKIIVGFHLIHIDDETGILINDLKSIAKKYLKEWKEFWLDVFTCFPFEIIGLLIKDRILYTCCWINRTLRFIHLIVYYENCKNKLTVSKMLKWTYLMYMMVIVIHFMTCIWWLISCPKNVCTIASKRHQKSVVFETSNSTGMNFRITYQYVISVFSSTSIRNQMPMTTVEIIISIFIVIISQLMVYTLTSGFATILCLGKYVLNNYDREINHLNTFMKNTHVSAPIINKVQTYFLILWLRYSGVTLPTLIAQAPAYLKQDIMYALYGHHITNHILFSKTHVDFIRQLLAHVVPQVYLPGEYIIEKGDIDSTMYFIHKGEVRILDKHGNNEIEQCVLKTGDSFGEYQALKNIEHARSARTAVMCIIISLKTADWSYLLDWFPASKETLESRLAEFSPV